MNHDRKKYLGANVVPGKGVNFRVYASIRKKISVVIGSEVEKVNKENGKIFPLEDEGNGYFSAVISEASDGNLYKYLFEDESLYPDPASHYQPYGPHGPSEIIDPEKFEWTDTLWEGVAGKNQIIYELHIGTFTHEGTWQSAKNNLEYLKDLGITIIEVMPIAEFSGKFGWGYDGVNLFAPYHYYGRPEDFKDFVNTAHALNIAVILDVVYNHLGPDGNYMAQYTNDFIHDKNITDWGNAINFDGTNSSFTRNFIKSNALYWIEEFHLDGLRFDATQDIHDNSSSHIILEITEEIKKTSKGRKKIFVAENESQDVRFILPKEKGGYGINALWNDDFHHSAIVALTGRNEAYYTDYLGKPQEFVSSIKYGFLFQGQYYKWQKKRRGTPAFQVETSSFVNFIQNHDQIANSGRGLRIHKFASIGSYKALTALMIFSPGIPMLFQGEEYAPDNPFFYFADHTEELAELISIGRTKFMSQFRSIATPEMLARLPVPNDINTFMSCKLNIADREKDKSIFDLHKDLIKIKKEDPVIKLQKKKMIDGAVLNDSTFVIRFFGEQEDDRILLVNLGVDLHLNPAPEPLLSPILNKGWQILWSSEDIKYGGNGTAPLETEDNWIIPGHAAVLLQPTNNLNK